MRREDMHLLSNPSRSAARSPHVHVRRRMNSNGALAKARKPLWIPETAELVTYHADYTFGLVRRRRRVPSWFGG